MSAFTLTRRLPADATAAALRHDVLAGLTCDPKQLPPTIKSKQVAAAPMTSARLRRHERRRRRAGWPSRCPATPCCCCACWQASCPAGAGAAASRLWRQAAWAAARCLHPRPRPAACRAGQPVQAARAAGGRWMSWQAWCSRRTPARTGRQSTRWRHPCSWMVGGFWGLSWAGGDQGAHEGAPGCCATQAAAGMAPRSARLQPEAPLSMLVRRRLVRPAAGRRRRGVLRDVPRRQPARGAGQLHGGGGGGRQVGGRGRGVGGGGCSVMPAQGRGYGPRCCPAAQGHPPAPRLPPAVQARG